MRPILLSMLAATLSLSGCCSLSRLFCGPDRSAWVPQRFDTPRQTVQTLFEALRRDDPEVLYLCLDQGYCRRLGLDSMTVRLAWPRIREQNPGLHVAGYSEIPEPLRTGADSATVTVDVVGQKVEIDLVRRALWELRFRRPDGSTEEQSGALPSFEQRIEIAAVPHDYDRSSQLRVAPFEFYHDGLDQVPPEAVEHVALTRLWLVSDIRSQPE